MIRRTLLSLFLVALASAASAATLHDTLDRTFDARPGATLTLSNTNGSVTVHSWNQPRIRVVAEKKVEGDSDEAQKAMRELRVDLTPQNGGLAIMTRGPKEESSFWDLFTGGKVNTSVKFDITVPQSMNVSIETVNGGIELADVRGSMKIETTNGKITVARCAGRLDAETTNGRIEAELTSVDANQPMRFETTNGRISLTLPGNVAARLNAETVNGSIRTELPITTSSMEKTSLHGTLNGGGPELRLRTVNGSIDIRKGVSVITR